jgi:hypothetical protein
MARGCEHNSKITEDCNTCISLRADMETLWQSGRINSYPEENMEWCDLSRVGEAHEGLTGHQVWYAQCYDTSGCQNKIVYSEYKA